MKLKFPQYPRFFTATRHFSVIRTLLEDTVLWGSVALLGIVNLRLLTPPISETWRQTLAVIHSPLAPDAHVALAQIHWQKGNGLRAGEELLLADSLLPTKPKSKDARTVLGVATTPLDLFHEWETEPKRLLDDYNLWKEITRGKPEYRDGWVTLGTLAYQLGKFSEAKTYFIKAESLDPNFETTKKLLSLLP